MAKIVRMKAEEHRRWRRNGQATVDAAGELVRVLELEEVLLLERVMQEGHKVHESATATMENGVTIEARLVQPDPNNKRTAYLDPYVDGHRVRLERELMREEIFKREGTCQLRASNGVMLCVLRDPKITRLVAGEHRNVPHPDRCVCARWKREPGRHHYLCQNNAKSPPEERGIRMSLADKADARMMASRAKIVTALDNEKLITPPVPSPSQKLDKTVTVAGARHQKEMPTPDDCVCKSFARTDGKEMTGDSHHPVCEWFEKWAAKHRPEEWIVDIDTGENLRPATLEEVAEADVSEQRGKSRLINIGTLTEGGRAYAVLPKVEEEETSDEPRAASEDGPEDQATA